MLRHRYRVSERRACTVLRQPRATQRYAPIERDDERSLTRRIIELAAAYGRYGYRRITAMLRREGWAVNHKRVERIWRREGLKVPKKQPKRGRLWLNDGSCVRLRAERKDHVWSYDFVADRTADGRAFRMLTVIDEYSRKLAGLADTGEFTAKTVRDWMSRVGVKTLFIEPGSPWENGYCESFNGKLRDELLARERFDTLKEAKVLIERWRHEYNTVRPHSSLRYRPPAPEAIASEPASATLQPPLTRHSKTQTTLYGGVT